MGKSLVIVESPAKAKTINRYLGSKFIVKSSIGHIRDLPTAGSALVERATKISNLSKEEKARRQLTRRMGVDPDRGWTAHYEILPGKEKVVSELKKLASQADQIYLATDLDREGEAIAWHLQETIGGDPNKYQRVTFSEITKTAIEAAFDRPSNVDVDRVNAQQARRFLDRVVGYMVSPLLWAKIARGLSAGRVQSVAVRLVVERERAIRAFVPEEYWEIFADLSHQNNESRFQVSEYQGQTFKPINGEQAKSATTSLNQATYQVVERESKPGKTRPPAPFITSTLQQAASQRLGFGVKKTMTLAQRLYEAGLITYMRTDSTYLSKDAIQAVRALVGSEFGANYLPETPNFYSSRENAQEAHEAIRPSDVRKKGADLHSVERDAQRLYELIWRQFVACQMTPANYLTTTIKVQADNYGLKARGKVTTFAGYQVILPVGGKGEDAELPDMEVGDQLKLIALDPQQKFTSPPARYNEASLVRELEKQGIGRPSTYAAIISTVQDRGYVEMENRRLFATKIGEIVTDRLIENFNDLMNYDFTASMEDSLDSVAEGRKDWIGLLDEFYAHFKQQLDQAASPEGMRPNSPTETDIPCSTCNRPMMIRTATTGVFLGCSGYQLPPKERCKTTMNLSPGEEAIQDGEDAETLALMEKQRCPICQTAMSSYLIDEKRKMHICGNNPDCSGHTIEVGQFKIKGYDGPSIECDKCGNEMQLKTGRFGKFFGCTSTPCKNTRKLLRNGQPAPPKMDPIPMPWLKCLKVDDTYVLRDGAGGLFLAASGFPKNRETRAPFVSELLKVKDQLDPKYHFILTAPVTDPDGNPSQVRFSRKANAQYVMSESEGKSTKWKVTFNNERWTAN
ncbi:MAG: DNA topoisomerase I subunit omega [Gammaproteobacteria bacterium]|nr:DNA topoisomerase I subunit omega [Gammaproteobacteria bacterium]